MIQVNKKIVLQSENTKNTTILIKIFYTIVTLKHNLPTFLLHLVYTKCDHGLSYYLVG
jgi:hypothetical protein